MIIIVDYKLGNVSSLYNMLRWLNIEARVSSDISDVTRYDKIILPGIGAFDEGMEQLKKMKLLDILQKKVLGEKILILGICLGMQLISKSSEEGKEQGLGWIDAVTQKFRFGDSYKNMRIPHIGWNTIKVVKNNPLLENLEKESKFYFLHSYHLVCRLKENILAESTYGYEFPSVINKENIFGVQFHPEKSHRFGMRILENFAAIKT